MHIKTGLLALGILMALATLLSAQVTPIYIPPNTVVPVSLDNSLNSATAMVGQRFFSHCVGPNCGGFPVGTTFVGTITSVTRYHGTTPGQIAVTFVQAQLPDGTIIPINGSLTSLHANDARYDPSTGRLVATGTSKRLNSRFIGYNAGAGFVIGALTSCNLLTGTLVGATVGYLYGATLGRNTMAREASVPAGTHIGIVMNNGVNLPAGTGTGPSAEGYYPPYGGGPINPPPITGPGPFTVNYGNIRPFTARSGIVMVPLRPTLNAIQMPFAFRTANRRVVVDTYNGELVHPINSNIIYFNGRTIYLSAPSLVINGRLYVPEDFMSAATGLTPSWYPSSGSLVLK